MRARAVGAGSWPAQRRLHTEWRNAIPALARRMARNPGLARPQRTAARRMAPAEQWGTVQAFARRAWRKRKGAHGTVPREQSRRLHAFVGQAQLQPTVERRMAPSEQPEWVRAFARKVRRKRKEGHGRDPRAQRWMPHAFSGQAPRQQTAERRMVPSEQPEWVRAFARTAWRKRTGARRRGPVERWGEPRWSTDKRQKHPAREPQRVSLQDDGPQKTGARAPQPQSRERRCVTFRMQRKRSKTRETRARTHLCRLAERVRRWTVSR